MYCLSGVSYFFTTSFSTVWWKSPCEKVESASLYTAFHRVFNIVLKTRLRNKYVVFRISDDPGSHFHFFQNCGFQGLHSVEIRDPDFPQSFQEVFPFHSTFFQDLHSREIYVPAVHFFTFSPDPDRWKKNPGIPYEWWHFNFFSPSTTTTRFILFR